MKKFTLILLLQIILPLSSYADYWVGCQWGPTPAGTEDKISDLMKEYDTSLKPTLEDLHVGTNWECEEANCGTPCDDGGMKSVPGSFNFSPGTNNDFINKGVTHPNSSDSSGTTYALRKDYFSASYVCMISIIQKIRFNPSRGGFIVEKIACSGGTECYVVGASSCKLN